MSYWTKEPPKHGYYWYRLAVDPHTPLGICYIDMSQPVMWGNCGSDGHAVHPLEHPEGVIEWWARELHAPPRGRRRLPRNPAIAAEGRRPLRPSLKPKTDAAEGGT